MTDCTFYSLQNSHGTAKPAKRQGFSDGTFYYYQFPETDVWYAIVPEIGMSIVSGNSLHQVSRLAHLPTNMRRLHEYKMSASYRLDMRKFADLCDEAGVYPYDEPALESLDLLFAGGDVYGS